MAQPVGQADLGERGRGQLPRLGGRLAQEERRDHGVLQRGQLAEQVVELEDEADLLSPVVDKPRLAAREQVLATKEDAARRGPVERAEEVEERGLADAGRAHERDDLARSHDEARTPKDAHDFGARPILLLELLGDQERLAHSYLRTSTGSSAPARRAGMIVARNERKNGPPNTLSPAPNGSFIGRELAGL